MGKRSKGVFVAALISLLGAMPAWAETPEAPLPQEAPQKSPLGAIRAVKALPIKGLVVVETEQGVIFASENGRFVTKGPFYDLWNRAEIKTMADVDAIANRVDLQKIGVDFSQLAAFTFGEGSLEEVIFVSPSCPHCQELLDQAAKLTKDYRFRLILLPQSRQDMDAARRMVCAKDQNQAVKALLTRNYDGLPEGKCPLTPLQKNLVTARVMGITSVPYMVRHDHMVNNGKVKDLAAWLKGAQETGGK